MASNEITTRVLKNLRLNNREGGLDDLEDIVEEYENQINEDEPVAMIPRMLFNQNNTQTYIDDQNDQNPIQMNRMSFDPSSKSISDTNLDMNIDKNGDNNIPSLKRLVSKESENIPPVRIKFGVNEHPFLKLWLLALSITGAPVYINSDYFKSNKLRAISITGISLTLLVIYHLLFINSAYHVLETLPTNKGLYDSVWLQIYPIVFNLAVVIVNDVMWIIGLSSSCWMTDILLCFKEKPRAKRFLIDVRYDYFGGEHKLIVDKNEHLKEEIRHKSKLKIRTEFMWKLLNFFVRQIVAFGCCFTYLRVSYHLLQPIQLDFIFITEIINVLLTSCAWLTILWIYMTFCQILRWRFQHLNDWTWDARRLLDKRLFRVLTFTYKHYLNKVTIVDDFFKYWIAGIFGVLFFQASLYFQFIINAFENWSPSLQLIIIPLITMPFLVALLLLIKRAAEVNAESKELDEIIVKICLFSRNNITDELYRKIKFFMWLVSEGSSLTIFGLVPITKKFMGTAIVVIFSYTLILHEFTPKESVCETILKNNLTLSLN